MNGCHSKWLVWCGVAVATLCASPDAHAGFIMTISQVGSDVVGTGSGTLNVSGLPSPAGGTWNALADPGAGILFLGATASELEDSYRGITGPTSFGSYIYAAATSGSGPVVGVYAATYSLDVPRGYVSGTFLSDTATWANWTIDDLGLTPGTYTYSWGSGANADSLVVEINGASPTPEPASLGLLCTGILLLGLARLKRCWA